MNRILYDFSEIASTGIQLEVPRAGRVSGRNHGNATIPVNQDTISWYASDPGPIDDLIASKLSPHGSKGVRLSEYIPRTMKPTAICVMMIASRGYAFNASSVKRIPNDVICEMWKKVVLASLLSTSPMASALRFHIGDRSSSTFNHIYIAELRRPRYVMPHLLVPEGQLIDIRDNEAIAISRSTTADTYGCMVTRDIGEGREYEGLHGFKVLFDCYATTASAWRDECILPNSLVPFHTISSRARLPPESEYLQSPGNSRS